MENIGRPSKISESTVKKLEEAFRYGANVSEACYHANISRQTFYNYYVEGTEFFDKIESAKSSLRIKAMSVIYNHLLMEDVNTAKWVLERKIYEQKDK